MGDELTVKQFEELLVPIPHDMSVDTARGMALKAYGAVCVSKALIHGQLDDIALTLVASQGELSHKATTELGQQVEALTARAPEPVRTWTLKDLVADWLHRHGYDGLCGEGCGCVIGDLMPCGTAGEYCQAGYRVPCPGRDGRPCECDGDCDFHVAPCRDGVAEGGSQTAPTDC